MPMLDETESYEVWEKSLPGQPHHEVRMHRTTMEKGIAFSMRDQYTMSHQQTAEFIGVAPTKEYIVVRCVTRRHVATRSIADRRRAGL